MTTTNASDTPQVTLTSMTTAKAVETPAKGLMPVNLDNLHEMDAVEQVLSWWAEDGTYIRYDANAQVWYSYEEGLYNEMPQRDTIVFRLTDTVRKSGAKVKRSTLNKLVNNLSLHPDVRIKGNEEERPEMLALANGILDMNTGNFSEASSTLFYTQRGTANYDPEATCPTFDKWLDGALPNKKHQATLLEYMAYCLSGYTHYQKFMFLFGRGGTGKGTISRVLEKLSGGYAASSGLHDLSSSRFATYNLRDKRLAVVSEVGRKKVNLTTLKQITGEDTVRLERKYHDPYQKKLATKLFITANEMFNLGADMNNDSIDRRLIILPFNVSQKDELLIPDLEQKLEAELSGILNRLLGAWDRLTEQKGFTLPRGDEDLFRAFLEDSNLIMYFFSTEFEEGDELGDLQARELYDWYSEWCRDTRNKRETETHFYRSLKPVFEKLGWDVQNKKPNNKSMWRGLTLKADSRLLLNGRRN